MTKLLRCKACGFIIKENELGPVCPACGANRVVFESYDDKFSEKRRNLLDHHIHPISTHFSIGCTVIIQILTIIAFIFPQFYIIEVFNTIYILTLLLPFFVVFTMISGMLDGKLRFKTLNTPHLNKKIIFGVILIVLSVFMALLSIFTGVSISNLIIFFLMSFCCSMCGAFLGKIGSTLLSAKLP